MTVKSIASKNYDGQKYGEQKTQFLWGTDKPTVQRRGDIRVNLGDQISGDNKQDPPKKHMRSNLQIANHGDDICFYGA